MEKKLYALTNPQQSIYLTEEYYKGTNINNIAGTLTIEQPVQFNQLILAIKQLIKQNDGCRIMISNEEQEVKQYIAPYQDFQIEIIDVSSEKELSELARKITAKPFELYNSFLFRFVLYRFPDNHGGFVVNMHHLIADSWTLGIVVNEIMEIYSSYLKQEEYQEKDATLYSYTNYIASEQEYKKSDKYQKDKLYWNEVFSTIPESATIPSIQTNATLSNSTKALREQRTIPSTLLKRIKEYCASKKVSVYNFLTAIISIYISRVSNLEDICIGTPILNRTNFKEKNTTGMFINTLPLRVNVNTSMTFQEFLNSVMTNSMSLLRHQKYSYQNIIEDLRKKQSNLPALYQIMVSYQITKINKEQETIPHESIWHFNENTADDIDIHIFDLNDTNELNIAYDYKTEKYTAQEMKQIHERILNMISQVLNNETIKISEIEIVTLEEKEKLIHGFNQTKMDYPKAQTMVQLFEEQVKLTPNHVALVFKDKSLTYQELNAKANQLAYYLKDNGVKKDDIVSVCMNKNISFIISILATLKCGAAYLPINPSYPFNRISYIVENSKSSVLITDTNYHIDFTKTFNFNDINYSKYSKDNLEVPISSDSLAYVIYTSGSTGNPKGVMVTHKNLVNFLFSFNHCFNNKFGNKDNCLSLTNISFDVSVCEIFTPFAFGATLVLYPEDTLTSIPLLCEILNKNKITFLYIPPSILNEVADFIISKQLTVYINKLLVGVEAIKNSTLNKFLEINHNMEIINGYGPTETTICTTFYKYQYSDNYNKNVPIGYPISNSNIFILDKNNNFLPIGTIGELCVSGDNVSKGYLNNTELTNQSFIYDKKISSTTIYKTGDLAYWTQNGILSFIGRNDSQIKFKGHRIELNEINNTLKKINAITNSYTLIKKVNNIDSICSYITTSENIKVDDIYENLSNNLPYYMIPSHIIPIDSFPLTLNGKIDKSKLPEIVLSTSVDNTQINCNETELSLIHMIGKLLNIENINIQDDLFDLGLDSLTAIKLVTEIYNTFNIEILIKDIFENASIKKLAKLIGSLSNTNQMSIPKTKQQEYYPVSSAQKRMYYASNLDSNHSLLYNIAGGIILDKILEKEKLEQCFHILINRHESLRTYFEIVDGNIMQKILDKVDFKLEYESVDTNDIDSLFHDFVKPFNLNKAPLFNAKLININNEKSFLLLNMHHIISDGTSLSILIDELCKLYNNESNLPELTISYKDFAVWESNKLNSEAFNQDKEFWVEQFKDEIPLLNMPTDYTRPTVQSFEGDNVFTQINSDLAFQLNQVSRNLGITPYMLLLSVYYILLYKYTGQNDIVVGSPIVGRDNIQLTNIIGMFVNSLALRNKIDSSMSFNDFTKEIKNNCLNAFEHQTYPFDELVSALEIKRNPSRNPLFDTMFIYQNNGNVSIDFDGAKSKLYTPKTNVSKFDLSLEIIPENNGFNLRFEYCSKLFNQDFITRLSKHYINILQTVINENDIKIANIDMLSKEEKEQIIHDFNNTKVDYPKTQTAIQLFEEQVKKEPDAIAVIFEEQKLTYRQLNEKANQLAHYLVENGVKNNDIIGIMLERSFEMIISMLAVLKANAAYMLIDVNLPENRILYMLNNANSTLLITASDIKNIDFDRKLFVDREKIDANHENNLNLNYNINNTFCIIYTSGSTGTPKGIELKNNGVVNLVLSYKLDLNTDICTNFISISTVAFDMFIVETFVPLLSGKTIILSNAEEQKIPTSISHLITKHQVDFILTTPSRMELLFMNDDTKKCLRNLKIMQLGGEIFTANLYDKLQECTNATIYNGYGPSEITACCSNKKVISKEVTIGKPNCNTQIYIVNTDLNLCPIGIEGEICISGSGLAKGYINNPTATAKAFVKNPFGEGLLYKTGDIGKYTSNGEIQYIGRKDFQIKLRGLRIELSEIEKQLLNIENIKNCVVIYKEEPNNNSYLKAFYTSEKEMDTSFIRTELSKHLPLYMVPKYIIKLDNMPITRNGKIDLKTLKEYKITDIETSNYVAPENEIQKLFCDTWEKLLHTKVGITDDIFELGADSLLAIKFKVELLSHNINVEYADIFKYPSVKELSEAKSITTNEQADSYDYTEINKILEKNNIKNSNNIVTNKTNNVLLLGSNGFVGMHILYEFIKKDNGTIYCIVRDKNNLSARTRILDALHFYCNSELDKFIDNRIIILKGDITKENFGLNTQIYNEIVNHVSIVINSSANVKHYGNFKNFEDINIGLTKKAIEFCEKYNKRFIQISTTSVSGEVNKNEKITFSENNLYIGQNLDNVYVKSKFEAERLILEHIAKGLKAQILRLGNITNRYSDGKFQINPNENAFVKRIQSFIKLGIIPDYLLNAQLEFTPVDLCALAIISIMQNYVPDFSVFHLYNNNYITMKDFIEILRKYNINLKTVNDKEFDKIIKDALQDEDKKDILSGIINELNSDNNLEIHSNINILSEFSRSLLYTIDFNWSKIDNDYIEKYIQYFKEIKFI